MRQQLGNSGFSLIEIIIASVILAIVVGTTLTLVSNSETKNTFAGTVQGSSTCLLEANKILSNIKEKGQARVRLNFPSSLLTAGPAIGTYQFANATQTDQLGLSTVESGVRFLDRWRTSSPGQYVYSLATDNNILQPHLLIMGYMNTLQALYNSNTSFCTAPGLSSYTDDGGAEVLIPPPSSTFLDNVIAGSATSSLRIQVFNTNTGARSCPGSVNIRPYGTTNNNLLNNRRSPPGLNLTGRPANHPGTATANEEVFDPEPTASPNLGFLVTATVQYTDRAGQAKSCTAQEKFQYNAWPENQMTLEFEDIDTINAVTPQNVTIDDANSPENINTTIRSRPLTNPPSYTNLNQSIFYGCNEDSSISPGVNTNIVLRLTRTRSGSIHMCRNLSQLRPAAAGSDYIATPEGRQGFALRVNLGVAIPITENNIVAGLTNTFYSTELITHDPAWTTQPAQRYYARKYQDNVNTTTDPFNVGLFYPQGTYYCLDINNCAGGGTTKDLVRKALPRFPRGSNNPGGTAGTHFINEGGFPYYYPLTRTGGATPSVGTTANWTACEKINVCGVNATFSGFRAESGNQQRDGYEMRFDDLPSGCEVHIQVAEVDAGYNVQSTEFREYIQEKTPGNWLCVNGNTDNATFNAYNAFGANTWFFACTGGGPPAGAPQCPPGASPPNGIDCCVPYPTYPRYKATHPN